MIQRTEEIPSSLNGYRFDRAAAEMFREFSRARLQTWIADGSLLVDGQSLRSKDKVYAGMVIALNAEPAEQNTAQPENISLDIVYEDDDLLIVDKPVGLVVHPGAGNGSGTLLNGLLHHCSALSTIPRGGIVHRIDKDTSGLLAVAKTLESQHALVQQLQARTLKREYEAVATGNILVGGRIDEPIGRHPTQRVKMAVTRNGKPAVTHYRVAERFGSHTHLLVQLETGRTHQIRVHMAHMGHALVGDRVYAGRPKPVKNLPSDLVEYLRGFPRQALHAAKLGLEHPRSGELIYWESQPPADFHLLLQKLREAPSRA